MQNPKTILLIGALVMIFGSIYYLESRKNSGSQGNDPIINLKPRQSSEANNNKSKTFEIAKEISSPDGFINTADKPISIADLIGKKVVLVDFWTYSCINCQRTQPYLNAWYEKYKDQGLEIIGVHTPEFEFEKKYENVAKAVKNENVKYPVVLDNDFSTWRDYKNQYWPRKYLIDIDGYIVYDHIGEGAYEETEKKIQELLQERLAVLGMDTKISEDISKPDNIIEVNQSMRLSPETYFGSARNENLGNGQAGKSGNQLFTPAKNIEASLLYLEGEWNIESEYAENKKTDAKISFRYQAKNVYFVAESDGPVVVSIFKDGVFVEKKTISSAGTYQVIADKEYGTHLLEIVIEKPGLKAFTFTFG